MCWDNAEGVELQVIRLESAYSAQLQSTWLYVSCTWMIKAEDRENSKIVSALYIM
jgi:hypothetical protein